MWKVRFNLRQLLFVVVAIAISLGLVAGKIKQAWEEEEAVCRLQELDVLFEFDYQFDEDGNLTRLDPTSPHWLRRCFGEFFFHHAVTANILEVSQITETEFVLLQNLHSLNRLEIANQTITDREWAIVKSLRQLEVLELEDCHINDDGLRHLSNHQSLGYLYLDGTNVSDHGLQFLTTLPRLVVLRLPGTRITDAAIESLCKLDRLEFLLVIDTDLSSEGVAKLRHALPECEVFDDAAYEQLRQQ